MVSDPEGAAHKRHMHIKFLTRNGMRRDMDRGTPGSVDLPYSHRTINPVD